MIERDNRFDNMKGVLILLVVVGHFCGGVTGRQVAWFSDIYNYIYLFHMPVFLMISGRFSKKRIEGGRYMDVFHKIFLPYLMLTTCMSLLRVALGLELAYDSILSPYFGLWYLLALVFYQVITFSGLVNRKWYLPAVIALIYLTGLLPGELYGKFTKIIYFYIFFLLGYYSNHWKLDWLKAKGARIGGWVYFLALIPLTVAGHGHISKNLLVMNDVFANMTAGSLLVSVLAFTVRMFIGFASYFALLAICSGRQMFITRLGKYSLYIYGIHIFVVYAMREILERNDWLDYLCTGINPWIYLALAVVLCFFLVSRPMRSWESYILEPWKKLTSQ